MMKLSDKICLIELARTFGLTREATKDGTAYYLAGERVRGTIALDGRGWYVMFSGSSIDLPTRLDAELYYLQAIFECFNIREIFERMQYELKKSF